MFKAQKGHSHQEVKFKETEYQAKLQSRLLTYRFGAYGLLSLVMTLPWLMAFIIVFSSNEDEKYQQLWYPFVIFQGLQVNVAQCGNFRIFLSFRFYVKSTLENLEVLKLPFFAYLGLWFFLIW